MQSAVLVMIDSICLPVCHSPVSCQKMQATIMQSSLEDIPMTLASSRLTSVQNSKGKIGSRGAE